MNININIKKTRIEILPLIDIVFLLLVFFIYAMLSMAVHRGLKVNLPESSTVHTDKAPAIAITIKSDGSVYIDKEKINPDNLAQILSQKKTKHRKVALFADKNVKYQKIFSIIDKIRIAQIDEISLQAKFETK